MWTVNVRPWAALAAICLLLAAGACSDDGTVPEIGDEGGSGGTPTDPTLEVTPEILRFDADGTALDAAVFVVKSNGSWRLEIPTEAQAWLQASPVTGHRDAEVSIALSDDVAGRSAELCFSVEGQTTLSRTVRVQVEAKADDNDPDPDDPSGSEPNPDDDASDPDDSKDDPNNGGSDNSEEDDPNGGDTSDSGDSEENQQPSDGSDTDTGSGTGSGTESGDPSPSLIPQIAVPKPLSLEWRAEELEAKSVEIGFENLGTEMLHIEIEGTHVDRFTHVSSDYDYANSCAVIRVQPVGVNDTDADIVAKLVISVGESHQSVSLTQKRRETTPDPDEGDDKDDENSDKEQFRYHDDFSCLQPCSTYMEKVETSDKWIGENCAVHSGMGGYYPSDPYFPNLLGQDPEKRGLSMNGDMSRVGKIEAPVWPGGSGELSFDYGITAEGDEQVGSQVVIFKVEIVCNEQVVKTFLVEHGSSKPLKYLTKYHFSETMQVSGEFRIVFTNQCPSRESGKGKDRYTIFNIEWTGCK